MSRFALVARSVVCAALLSSLAALAQSPAYAPAAPVPTAILTAKKLFLSNSGASGDQFSGGPNRTYNQFYTAFQTANLFTLVTDPSDADLVLEPRVISTAIGNAFDLAIYDRKTHFLLWTLIEPIKVCTRQKACDTNFDDAVAALLLDFENLGGKTPAAR